MHSSRRVNPQPKISESCQFLLSLNRDQWLHPTVRRLQVRQILLGKVREKRALPEVSITDNLQTVPRAALHSFIKTETVAGPAYCNTLCVASMQRMMLGIRLRDICHHHYFAFLRWQSNWTVWAGFFLPFYVHKLTHTWYFLVQIHNLLFLGFNALLKVRRVFKSTHRSLIGLLGQFNT